MESNIVVYASWEDDENWTKIHTEKVWQEIMEQACEILAPEDNGSLLSRLVVIILKQKNIISRLKR